MSLELNELKKYCDVHVLDDFYADPHAVREFALSCRFFGNSEKTAFAGTQTEHPIVIGDVIETIAGVIGSRPVVDTQKNLFGQFRLTSGTCQGQTKVHFDRPKWSLIVYLTPTDSTVPGTVFYRHRKTNLINPHLFPGQTEFSTIEELIESVIHQDSLLLDRWETIGGISYRFNRGILFRGDSVFHAAGPGFGHDKASCRLTQHFFFDLEEK